MKTTPRLKQSKAQAKHPLQGTNRGASGQAASKFGRQLVFHLVLVFELGEAIRRFIIPAHLQ